MSSLSHHGIKGQRWGIRRFQNKDGTRTALGKHRDFERTASKVVDDLSNSPQPFIRRPLNKDKIRQRGLITQAEADQCAGLAAGVFKQASKVEPQITGDVIDVVSSTSAKMYGLNNRLKQPTSIAAKIGSDAKSDGVTFEQAANGLKDVIRYTAVSDSRDYVDTYNAIKQRLENKGYTEIKCKNYFQKYQNGEVMHKAVQSTFRSPDGVDFEFQFQTPESQAAKELKVPIYNERRKAGNTPERNAELEQEMRNLAEQVPDPEGVFGIESHSGTKNMKHSSLGAMYDRQLKHTSIDASPYLSHHGIKGQKWGVRRFQNKDGTRTSAGKKRYSVEAVDVDQTRGEIKNLVKRFSKKDKEMFFDKHHPDGEYDKSSVDDLVERGVAKRFVVKEGKNIVGFIDAEYSGRVDPSSLNVVIGVDKSARGKGYASILSKKLVDWYDSEGYRNASQLEWNAYDENVGSKKAAEKAGFKQINDDFDNTANYVYGKNKGDIDNLSRLYKKRVAVEKEVDTKINEAFKKTTIGKLSPDTHIEAYGRSFTPFNTELNRYKSYFVDPYANRWVKKRYSEDIDRYNKTYSEWASVYEKYDKKRKAKHTSIGGTMYIEGNALILGGSSYLEHHGIRGQRWGVRRFQNKDGTLTREGQIRFAKRNLKRAKVRNLDKWGKSPDSNVLYIIGTSGSGKSTTAKGLADDGDQVIHLDTIFEKENHGSPDSNKDFEAFLKENNVDISKASDFSIPREERWQIYDAMGDLVEAYGQHCFSKGSKVVIEGVQMGDQTLYPDKNYFNGKPTVVLKGNIVRDTLRADRRDGVPLVKTVGRLTDKERWNWYKQVNATSNEIKYTSIGGTTYIEGNALILGGSSYLEHHGIRGQRWGVRRFQNRDGSLTNAGRKRLGYATKGAVQTVGKAFKAGVKAGGNAVKAAKAHHEKKEAEKLQKKKEKASKTRLGVMANKDLFTNEEFRKLNERFKLEDEMKMATLQKGVEIAKAVGVIAQNVGTVAKAYEDVTGTSLSPIKKAKQEAEAKEKAEDRKRKLAKEDAETKRAEDKEKRDIEDRERRIKFEDEDRVRKQAKEDADAQRAENAEKRAQAKEQRDSSMAVELQRKAKAAADEQEHKAVKAKAESRSAILDVLDKINKIQDHDDDDDHNNPPGGGVDTWNDDDYLNFFKKTGIIHSDISDPSLIQNGVLFVDSSDGLTHHGVKGQRWGVRRFQNPDGTLTAAGKKRDASRITKELNKNDKALAWEHRHISDRTDDYERWDKKAKKAENKGNLEKAEKFKQKRDETSAKLEEHRKNAKSMGEKTVSLISEATKKGYDIKTKDTRRSVNTGGEIAANIALNVLAAAAGSPVLIKRQKYVEGTKYKVKVKHDAFTIQDGILFINAGEPYLEHHGVKGMKWGKHLMAGKGEAGAGGGGGEDDEKLKEMAKKAGMTVAEYKQKFAGKLSGAASKIGEKISIKDKHLVINGSRSGSRSLAVGETGEKPKSFKEKAYDALGGKYKTQAAEAHREMVQKRNDADDIARRANAQGRAANANKRAGNVREYMANKEGARQLDAEAKGARTSQWEATKKANRAQWKYDHSIAGLYDKATGKYKQAHKKTAIPKMMDRWKYEYKDGPNSKLFNNGKGKAKTAKEQAKADVWNAADHQIKAKEYNDVASSQGGNTSYYGQAYKNAAAREARLAEGSYRRAAALGKQAASEGSTSSRPRARKKRVTSGGSGVAVRRPGRKPVSRTKRVTKSSTGVKRRSATGTGAKVRRGA